MDWNHSYRTTYVQPTRLVTYKLTVDPPQNLAPLIEDYEQE
jgi:hypothetical protein